MVWFIRLSIVNKRVMQLFLGSGRWITQCYVFTLYKYNLKKNERSFEISSFSEHRLSLLIVGDTFAMLKKAALLTEWRRWHSNEEMTKN